MNADKQFQEKLELLRGRMEELKKAPPLEKARTFLKTYCALNLDLSETESHLRHSLGFNSLPLWVGLEGLRAVLADTKLPAQTLVLLVRTDARREQLPATPAAAREFLEQVVALLQCHLPVEPEAEGVVSFGLDEVFTLRPEGAPVRLRCIDMIAVDKEAYAVLGPEHASEEQGPFTVYRYRASVEKPLEYERVTDADLIAKVLKASRA